MLPTKEFNRDLIDGSSAMTKKFQKQKLSLPECRIEQIYNKRLANVVNLTKTEIVMV